MSGGRGFPGDAVAVTLTGAFESYPRLVTDDVESKQRFLTYLIANPNVVAALESSDDLAAAIARGRESESARQKLHARRGSR